MRVHTHSHFSPELMRQVSSGELDIAIVAAGEENSRLVCLEDEVAQGRQLYLGMTLLDSRASTKLRRAVDLPDVSGLLVNKVSAGSRAEELGFRKGDLVTAIERQAVTTLVDIRKILNKPELKTKKVRVVCEAENLEFKLTNSSI